MTRKELILLVAVVIAIFALGTVAIWYRYDQIATQVSRDKNSNTLETSGPQESPIPSTQDFDAPAIVTGLQEYLVGRGYESSTLASSSSIGIPVLWWIQANSMAVNVPPTGMYLDSIAASSDTNSLFNEDGANSSPANDPQIQRFLSLVESYLSSQGLSLQDNESRGGFSWAYSSPNGVICRFSLYDPSLGEYEPFPYTYAVEGACSDASDYEGAVSAQLPLLQALWPQLSQENSYGNSLSEDLPLIYATSSCSNDSSTMAVLVYANGINYYFLKNVNGNWVDTAELTSGTTPGEVAADCGDY